MDKAPEAGGGPPLQQQVAPYSSSKTDTQTNTSTPKRKRAHSVRQLLRNLEGRPGLRQQPKLMVAAVWTSGPFSIASNLNQHKKLQLGRRNNKERIGLIIMLVWGLQLQFN